MDRSTQLKLKQAASNILEENVFSGVVDTGYTAASGSLYPFQWLWDTFFIAGWTENVDQGIQDVEKFLASQADNGFLGHIRYNREVLAHKEYFPGPEIYFPDGLPPFGEITSKITQPPNAAYGIWELAGKIINPVKKKAFLGSIYPKVFKYHQYLYDHLVLNSLMVTIHPWQAGDDNSPKWDLVYEKINHQYDTHSEVVAWLTQLGLPFQRLDTKLLNDDQRPIKSDYDIYLFLIKLYNQYGWDEKTILSRSPFRICEPLTNSVLLRSNLCLKNIAQSLGQIEDLKIIDRWIEITKQGLESLYDPKTFIYNSLDLNSRKLIKIPTVSGLMPLFSLGISVERAAELAVTIRQLHSDHPNFSLIPSTFPNDPHFEPNRYWRGPTWIITNTLLSDSLRHYGHHKLAALLDEHSLTLVNDSLDDRGGFFEYFNPVTKAGLGSPKQSWTAAAVIKILS